MSRSAKKKKVQTTAPQQSQKEKGNQRYKQTPLNHAHNTTGEKYVSSAGHPLQNESLQHQRTYQETVRVNCNQTNIGRSPSRPTPTKHALVNQPRQVNNVRGSRAETSNSNSQVTQPRGNSNESPKGRKKRKRQSRKLLSKDEDDQEQAQEKSQPNVFVLNHMESSQTTTPVVYYAIRNGAYGYYGVHTDWNVCARYLKGTAGVTFKSFTDEEEAFEFAHGDYHEVVRPPLEKKLKREEPHQATKVKSQETTEARVEERSRNVVSSREANRSTRRRQQHRQEMKMKPRSKVSSPAVNGLISGNPQRLPLNVEQDSIEVEDDSADETEESRLCEMNGKTQQAPRSEPSSEVQFVEEISRHTVKAEPILQPATLPSLEAERVTVKIAKNVKTEVLPAKIGPRKNLRKHVR